MFLMVPVEEKVRFWSAKGTSLRLAKSQPFMVFNFKLEAFIKLGEINKSLVAESEVKLPYTKFNIEVCILDDPRGALAHASALFYGSQPEVVVAVTGTNGKTSVAFFYYRILNLLGIKVGSIGTLGVFQNSKKTFPDIFPKLIFTRSFQQ